MKNKIFFIAEVGINHNGELDTALQMIKQAKEVGFDAVKFQKRTPEICVPDSKKNIIRVTPWGDMSYIDYKKKLEFGRKEYDAIDEYCKKLDVEWFASAWDIPSFNFLRSYDLHSNKVASAMITNIPFLKEVANSEKYTFISTGMCEMSDIQTAVTIFEKCNTPFMLMHAVSTYPCPESMCNIRMVEELRNRFGCDVGYSGHEEGIIPSVLAVLLGAKVIERHITLNRAMWGTDQPASLERRGQEILIRDCNSVSKILGNGVKTFTDDEKRKEQMLRYWI